MPPASAKPARPAKATKNRRSPAALVFLSLLTLGVSYFAVQGGEYGTTDLFRQRSRLQRLQHEVDSLKHQVDSLKDWKHAIETDPLVQERLAREEFGMTKGDKEMLYRFAEDRR